jgi:hypothetical protein
MTIAATQAAAEYATLLAARATNFLGRQADRLQVFASEHFLGVVLGVLGFVMFLMVMTRPRRR